MVPHIVPDGQQEHGHGSSYCIAGKAEKFPGDCQQALQMVTQLRGTSHSHCGLNCQGPLALQKKHEEKLWPLFYLIKPCSLAVCSASAWISSTLPSRHLFYLSSSTIPFPWVNKMLFVKYKETKMCVNVINVLIIIKIIVTREVNFFLSSKRS